MRRRLQLIGSGIVSALVIMVLAGAVLVRHVEQACRRYPQEDWDDDWLGI